MASLNKVMLIGNLGRDPEVRYMPSGDAITNEFWLSHQTGTKSTILHTV